MYTLTDNEKALLARAVRSYTSSGSPEELVMEKEWLCEFLNEREANVPWLPAHLFEGVGYATCICPKHIHSAHAHSKSGLHEPTDVDQRIAYARSRLAEIGVIC